MLITHVPNLVGINGRVQRARMLIVCDEIFIRDFNSNPDPRLTPKGIAQHLRVTGWEKTQLALFLTTLNSSRLCSDEKWSDPFVNGKLTSVPRVPAAS